jgi:hypothetical protein
MNKKFRMKKIAIITGIVTAGLLLSSCRDKKAQDIIICLIWPIAVLTKLMLHWIHQDLPAILRERWKDLLRQDAGSRNSCKRRYACFPLAMIK